MEEIWKPINGWEGLYEISSFGRLKACEKNIRGVNDSKRRIKERVINSYKNQTDYLCARLWLNKKITTVQIHTLVLETFKGPRPKGMIGLHNDGNHRNNRLSNLRWGTYKENSQDAIHHKTLKTKLSKIDIERIREAVLFGSTQAALCRAYGISSAHMGRIVRNTRRTYLTD